jgi:hypothetical protein
MARKNWPMRSVKDDPLQNPPAFWMRIGNSLFFQYASGNVHRELAPGLLAETFARTLRAYLENEYAIRLTKDQTEFPKTQLLKPWKDRTSYFA